MLTSVLQLTRHFTPPWTTRAIPQLPFRFLRCPLQAEIYRFGEISTPHSDLITEPLLIFHITLSNPVSRRWISLVMYQDYGFPLPPLSVCINARLAATLLQHIFWASAIASRSTNIMPSPIFGPFGSFSQFSYRLCSRFFQHFRCSSGFLRFRRVHPRRYDVGQQCRLTIPALCKS